MADSKAEILEFKEEWIAVSDLTVDHSIQRDTINMKKVARIEKNYNPAAIGVITVSRRNAVTVVVLDGMHRVEVVRRKTGGAGKVLCHVFEGLTRAEEAQIFLDLNYGNQPNIIEKYKVKLVTEDPDSLAINRIVKAYGWTVAPGMQQGVLQCVGTLERVYALSQELEAEPSLLQMALMTVTHAWGNIPAAGRAVVIEGIAAMYAEYKDTMNPEVLVQKLKLYPGGPEGLYTDAQYLSRQRRSAITMAVAETLVDEYNKGRKTRTLHVWRQRRPRKPSTKAKAEK